MKRCFKCGVEKPRSEFYRHPKMADGLLGKCKTCTIADTKAAYRRDLEASREKRLWRNLSAERRSLALTANAHHRERHPDRIKARRAVNNAVRDGRLKKEPCEACGSPKSEGHHPDHSRPLEVQWLCLRHHREKEGRLLK